MWARLSDIDSSCIALVTNDPTNISIRLSQQQNFFFATTYHQQKKGPTYGVRNEVVISFKTTEFATSFKAQIKKELPVSNY